MGTTPAWLGRSGATLLWILVLGCTAPPYEEGVERQEGRPLHGIRFVRIPNGACELIGPKRTPFGREDQRDLRCTFDPSSCPDGYAVPCNAEIDRFLRAAERFGRGRHTGSWHGGLVIQFPATTIYLTFGDQRLETPAPVTFRESRTTVECQSTTFWVDSSAVPQIRAGTASVRNESRDVISSGDLWGEVREGDLFLGPDQRSYVVGRSSRGQCTEKSDTRCQVHADCADAGSCRTEGVPDRIVLASPYEGPTEAARPYRISTGKVFEVAGTASTFRMAGGWCHVLCFDDCDVAPRSLGGDAPDGLDRLGTRKLPVRVVDSIGAVSSLERFWITDFNHKDDIGILAHGDGVGSRVGRTLGGVVHPTTSAGVARYLRTGTDPADPRDNGRGACYASLVGGVRVAPALPAGNYCSTGYLILGNPLDHQLLANGAFENTGRLVWAPNGVTNLYVQSPGGEQDMNCHGSRDAPGELADCELDPEAWIDIGPRREAWPGKIAATIMAPHVAFPFSTPAQQERPFLRVADPLKPYGRDGGDVHIVASVKHTSKLLDLGETIGISGQLSCYDSSTPAACAVSGQPHGLWVNGRPALR